MEEPAATLAPVEDGPPLDPRLGGVLDGRYRIVGLLGEGGMGLVYEATHVFLKTRVALKVLRADVADKEAIERLKREAQSASAIGNPHIVNVRDFGTLSDGATYVAMEYIEGVDLLAEIRRGPLPAGRTRDIAVQVADALAAAHEQGIVHRDLKPENILLTVKDGRTDYVKLVDFGIARIQGATKLTAAGRVVGTPEYMAPEQCAGIDVDHRADIYALGVLLYEMLTGSLPFADPDLVQLLRKQIKDAPVAPSKVAPEAEIPLELEAIVLRCLAKRPSQRFQSMTELGEALQTLKMADAPALDASEADPFERVGNLPTQLAMSTPPPAVAPRPTPRAQPIAPARVGSFIALGAIALGLGALSAVWLLRDPASTRAPATPPLATRPEPAPTRAPDPVAVDERPAVAPPVASQITIETVPPGARAYRDGALIGETPISLVRPGQGERVVLTLMHRGYRDEEIAIGSLSAAELTVTLAARPRGGSSGTSAAAEPSEPTAEPQEPVREPAETGAHRPGFMNPWE